MPRQCDTLLPCPCSSCKGILQSHTTQASTPPGRQGEYRPGQCHSSGCSVDSASMEEFKEEEQKDSMEVEESTVTEEEEDMYSQEAEEERVPADGNSEEDDISEILVPSSMQGKVWSQGVLTKAAVLELLAEQGQFHNASTEMMTGVVHIINLLLLDGGSEEVLPDWGAVTKMLSRKTARVESQYILCPKGCRDGVMAMKHGEPRPTVCVQCRQRLNLDRKSLPQFFLWHFSVVQQLQSILPHPAVRPYVNTNGTRVRCLYVPTDMKECPAWRELVHNPTEIVLALFFDGVPVWRSQKKRGTYSLHFITLELLNIPFFLRADPRFVMVTDLIPGPKKPKNVRACFLPLVRELRKARYEVLFSSADYVAQVELLQHQQLGYQGCVKCFHVSKFISAGCYDWATSQAQTQRLRCKQTASGEKTLTRQDNHEHGAAVWARWNAALQRFQMSEAKQRVVDQRWDNFCKGSRRSCTAKPFASGGSMTGEDWYVLAQQGEWIFDGLLRGEVLEYVVTLCTLFRLMAAPKQNPARLATMMTLCDRFQYIHTRLMPPPCRPLQFHRLQHGVESVKDFGPMFIYWYFRAERTMGRLVKMVRRRNGVEAHLPAVLRKELIGRQMLPETEHDFFRRQLEEAGRERRTGTKFQLDGRSREFAEFVLQGKRVEKGLELGGKIGEGGSLCFIAVVPYRVKQAAILARRLTTLDNMNPLTSHCGGYQLRTFPLQLFPF
eukprot:g72488.t1